MQDFTSVTLSVFIQKVRGLNLILIIVQPCQKMLISEVSGYTNLDGVRCPVY